MAGFMGGTQFSTGVLGRCEEACHGTSKHSLGQGASMALPIGGFIWLKTRNKRHWRKSDGNFKNFRKHVD